MSSAERDAEWLRSASEVLLSLRRNWEVGFCAGRAACVPKAKDFAVMAGYPVMKSAKLQGWIKDGIRGFKRYRERYVSESCSVGVFLHSLYCNDEEGIRFAVECMEQGAEFLTVHVAEDEQSAIWEQEKCGCSAVAALFREGLLTRRTLLVHCGWCSGHDLDRIAEAGATIAVCPISNSFLHTHSPDIRDLNARGIPWVVCTDGLATGRTFSLLKQAAELKRRQPWVEYEALFDAMTIRPALFYGKRRYTGRIDCGSSSELLQADWDGPADARFLKALIEEQVRLSYYTEVA